MASTNMKNANSNYCLERQISKNHEKYNFYTYKKIPLTSKLPDLGINGGNMISGYYYNVLSNNTCDIESNLYGIGTSDLVNGPKNVYPDLNKLDNVSFFKNKIPQFLPEPLIVEKNQRPEGPYSS
jgi:hypothetical protein